ncbi:MAG: hypothetical protein WC352_04035 [Candidatus Omnitrophota bacterium]|jgi:hypothetical protein
MRIEAIAGAFFLTAFFVVSEASALTPVKGSEEDLYWTAPMTVHDYKRDTDFHNLAVSAMAFTELEFVRLGDGLLEIGAKNKRNPISKSLDSLEFAYSQLPRSAPVRRFGQFWDALQLRELSLSDARLAGSVLIGDAYGGITPIMQVRAYKLLVLVEDVLDDMDRTVMFPFNWGASLLRGTPTRVKSIGYAGDGLGIVRWQTSTGLKWVSREIVRASSNVIHLLEEPHDAMIRSKRRKLNDQMMIYSKMPLDVFLENKRYFRSKNNAVIAGTPALWRNRIALSPLELPDNLRQEDFQAEDLSSLDPSTEIILGAPHALWDKAPRKLKKYVIAPEELTEILRQQEVPSPTKAP